jgi:hypothetical protein
VVLWRLVEGDLEPAHPIAVSLAASSEAIDALPGAKRGSPRVVPDETKLAITDRTSRDLPSSKTSASVGHCCLLLVLSLLFVDHLFSPPHFMNLCPLSMLQPKTIAISSSIVRG